MWDNLIKIGLAPVLLAQGRYVRRVTPELPEAAGDRQGERGSGEPLRLLVVGDSAAAGVGVDTQDEALVGRLVEALGTDFRVSWQLIARSGWTTGALIRHLRTQPDAPFDVVVTSLGVNDVLAGKPPRVWGKSQLELIELLREKFGASQIILTHVPPMHHFPALPQPLRWFLGRAARRLNRELVARVDPMSGCDALAVEFPLETSLMASDGFHPGAAGYALWAERLAAMIRGCRGRL